MQIKLFYPYELRQTIEHNTVKTALQTLLFHTVMGLSVQDLKGLIYVFLIMLFVTEGFLQDVFKKCKSESLKAI